MGCRCWRERALEPQLAGVLELEFPLRGATYYVGGGGNCRLINNHKAHEPQEFAIDLVCLNAFGNRAVGLAPSDLERYAIYGDIVHSPCAGSVTGVVDGFLDFRPAENDTENLAGNHVVFACEGFEVILAHLKRGSVTVTVGRIC